MTVVHQLPAALAGLALLTGLLLYPQAAAEGARAGTDLFLGTLLPSLLPFLIAGQLLLQPRLLVRCSRALSRVMPRLFALPGDCALALCLSVASGYPAGARAVGELAAQGRLTPEQARRAALLASHAGPAFTVGYLGAALPGSGPAGALLWLCHLAASLPAALLRGRRRPVPLPDPPAGGMPGATFPQLIMATVRTLASVGTSVVLFSVILALLRRLGLLDALARALAPLLPLLGLPGELAPALVCGAVELSSGCRMVLASGAALPQRMQLLAFLLAFGGLCIHAQCLAFLPMVRWRQLLAHKTAQALISMALTRAVFEIVPLAQPVFSGYGGGIRPGDGLSLLLLAGCMLAVSVLFYLLLALAAGMARD